MCAARRPVYRSAARFSLLHLRGAIAYKACCKSKISKPVSPVSRDAPRKWRGAFCFNFVRHLCVRAVCVLVTSRGKTLGHRPHERCSCRRTARGEVEPRKTNSSAPLNPEARQNQKRRTSTTSALNRPGTRPTQATPKPNRPDRPRPGPDTCLVVPVREPTQNYTLNLY